MPTLDHEIHSPMCVNSFYVSDCFWLRTSTSIVFTGKKFCISYHGIMFTYWVLYKILSSRRSNLYLKHLHISHHSNRDSCTNFKRYCMRRVVSWKRLSKFLRLLGWFWTKHFTRLLSSSSRYLILKPIVTSTLTEKNFQWLRSLSNAQWTCRWILCCS